MTNHNDNVEDPTQIGGGGTTESTSPKKQQQRSSSILSRARMSFMRSKGQRGASVQTLRGTKGADFEGLGSISRGAQGLGCGCFGAGSSKNRFILIKGPFCFVFASESATSPLYAIGLQYLKAEIKSSTSASPHPQSHSNHVHVMLVDNLGNTQYEFDFDSESTAHRFAAVVTEQAEVSYAEEVRKRLGHAHLLNKRSSVRYAETIAKQKVGDQPDKPISAQELLDAMPVSNQLM